MREKQDPQLRQAFYLVRLECDSGECLLISVRFTPCVTIFDKPVMFPQITPTMSTRAGNLRVADLGNVLEAEEHFSRESKTTYRFGYVYRPGKRILGPKATSFEAVSVDVHPITKRLAPTEWVAVAGDLELQEFPFNCPTLLLPVLVAK